jgi:hypothetical protein
MTTHPARCIGCAGSGWQDAPPLYETVNGLPHPYTTVKPCEHDFWNDDNGWTQADEPIPQDHPRAQAAFQRGYQQGIADIDALRTRQPPQRRRSA